MQADEPTDYVVATSTSYSVGDFVRMAFEHVGLDCEKHAKCDLRSLRPTEVADLASSS